LKRSRERFFDAGLNIVRAALVIGAVVALYLSRNSPSLYVPLPVAVLTTLCLGAAFGRGRNVHALAGFFLLYGIFVSLRSLADETGIAVQYAYVIDFERAVFGAVPTVWLQDQLYDPTGTGLLDVLSAAVYFSYFPILPAVIVLLWLRRSPRFTTFATAVLFTTYAGLLTCLLLPTAPPWLAAEAGLIPETARIFRDMVTATSSGSYEAGHAVAGPNPVAAMPSLHMAITVLVALTAASYGRIAVVLGCVYTASMAFALCYLGEHYVIDIAAGAVVACLAYAAVSRVWAVRRTLQQEPAPTPPAPAPQTLPVERVA
jgi:membrane-associated phospholipid phosphatase